MASSGVGRDRKGWMMAMLRYAVKRFQPATDERGNDVSLCLCVIEHENGHIQQHVINEELIRYAGEGIIDIEVKEAAIKGDYNVPIIGEG